MKQIINSKTENVIDISEREIVAGFMGVQIYSAKYLVAQTGYAEYQLITFNDICVNRHSEPRKPLRELLVEQLENGNKCYAFDSANELLQWLIE